MRALASSARKPRGRSAAHVVHELKINSTIYKGDKAVRPQSPTLCPSGLKGWTQVPQARAASVQIPQMSFLALCLACSQRGGQNAAAKRLRRQAQMTSAGLESAIPGSIGRCLIHWATRPIFASISTRTIRCERSCGFHLFSQEHLRKHSSAGESSPMATMYSATRPLCRLAACTSRSELCPLRLALEAQRARAAPCALRLGRCASGAAPRALRLGAVHAMARST